MVHSIIIPYRNRLTHLAACFRWLSKADLPEKWKCKVLVCESPIKGGRAAILSAHGLSVTWQSCGYEEGIFNKNVLLNRGIDRVINESDVVTFLDCDSLIGNQFFHAAQLLMDDPALTRVCYRVRYLPVSQSTYAGIDDPRLDDYIQAALTKYDTLDLAHEGRVLPEQRQTWGEPLFGNSQWSIRAEILGNLRFDEEYIGAGHEDLAMIRTVWQHFGDEYRAIMPGTPPGAADMNILQLDHSREQADWRTKEIVAANHNRYQKTARKS